MLPNPPLGPSGPLAPPPEPPGAPDLQFPPPPPPPAVDVIVLKIEFDPLQPTLLELPDPPPPTVIGKAVAVIVTAVPDGKLFIGLAGPD